MKKNFLHFIFLFKYSFFRAKILARILFLSFLYIDLLSILDSCLWELNYALLFYLYYVIILWILKLYMNWIIWLLYCKCLLYWKGMNTFCWFYFFHFFYPEILAVRKWQKTVKIRYKDIFLLAHLLYILFYVCSLVLMLWE